MDYIKIYVNLSIFLIFTIIFIVFISKINIKHKGYKLLFIAYTIFWIPLMMTREYSGKVQNMIDREYTWLVLSSYGIIGVFIRPLFDFISLKLKNRKIILYSSIIIVFILILPFLIVQNTTTATIQSIGIGVGASMIGTYELFFKEQYTEKNRSFLTVSILAIPPLLADFLSSSIQSTTTLLDDKFIINGHFIQLSYMLIWFISIFFLLICFCMIIFIKEDRGKIGLVNKNEIIINDSSKLSYVWLALICILGFIIAFVKFSNSGSVAITNMDELNQNINNKYDIDTIKTLQGYVSLVFSFFQLCSSFLIYYFAVKLRKKEILFILGIGIWIIYHILVIIIKDPIAYFALSSLNGISYGILYNLALGFVLGLAFSNKKTTPMGWYQSILSLGIAISTFFTQFLKNNIDKNFNSTNIIINSVMIGLILVSSFLYFIILKSQDKILQK